MTTEPSDVVAKPYELPLGNDDGTVPPLPNVRSSVPSDRYRANVKGRPSTRIFPSGSRPRALLAEPAGRTGTLPTMPLVPKVVSRCPAVSSRTRLSEPVIVYAARTIRPSAA